MQTAKGQRQLEWMEDLMEPLWRQERILLSETSALEDLAEVFPRVSQKAGGAPMDLAALNDYLDPRGVRASWEEEGLVLFRKPQDS